jgi:hypothetical protein
MLLNEAGDQGEAKDSVVLFSGGCVLRASGCLPLRDIIGRLVILIRPYLAGLIPEA